MTAAPHPVPAEGDVVAVRGTVAHVTPGGLVCLATAKGYVWASLEEIVPAGDPAPLAPDADLFG